MRRRILSGVYSASLMATVLAVLGYFVGNGGRWLMMLATGVAVGAMLMAGWMISGALRRRLRAELELEDERHFIKTIFDATPDLVYVYDLAQRRYVYLNRSFPNVLGYSPEAIIAMGDSLISELVHPQDLQKLGSSQERLLRAGDGRREDTEFRMKHSRGNYRWLRASEVVFKRDQNGDPTQILGVATDITARKTAEDQLAEANVLLKALATTDSLTGVANRRQLFERLELELARSKRSGTPVSILLADVDRFKDFNDAFGHPAGDGVLRRVAELLTSGVRDTDLVARYGGEEFAVLLPGSDSDEARRTAERLRQMIENEAWTQRSVTASFGVATGAAETAAEDLVAAADQALYASKAGGRNQVTLL